MGFGQASDQIKFAPKAQLTAIIDDWGPYYVKRVQAALDGTWKSDNTWGGMDTGMVKMAPYTNMPASLQFEAIKLAKIYIKKKDVEDADHLLSLYTYDNGDEFLSTISEDEDYYIVPSNSYHKLEWDEIEDQRNFEQTDADLNFEGNSSLGTKRGCR